MIRSWLEGLTAEYKQRKRIKKIEKLWEKKMKRIIGSGETLGDLRDFVDRTKDYPANTVVRSKNKMEMNTDTITKGATVDTLTVEVEQ